MTPTLDALGLLLVVGLTVTLGYSFTCWIWPFRACPRCHGTGTRGRRLLRLCARCDATGLRLRAGRRVWNYLRRHRPPRRDQRREDTRTHH